MTTGLTLSLLRARGLAAGGGMAARPAIGARRALVSATPSGSKRRAAFENAKAKAMGKAPEQPNFLKAAAKNMKPGYGWGGKVLATEAMKNQNVADLSPITGEEFRERAKTMLDKVRGGFAELEADNAALQISAPSEWDLEVTVRGTDTRFAIQVVVESNELIFITPESGGRTYFLDEASGRWRDRGDGHSFDGLLTRDVMRHLYGVPNFAL